MVDGSVRMVCASTDPFQCGSRLSSVSSVGQGSHSVSMKAAPGPGTATNFYLFTYGRQDDKSQPWNEIDFEVLGKRITSNSTRIWTNYFIGQGQQFPKNIIVPFDASAAFHEYTIEISGSTIKWIVDGTSYRVEDMSAFPDMLNTIASSKFQILLSLWGKSTSSRPWSAMGVLESNENPFPLEALFRDVSILKVDVGNSHFRSLAGCPRTNSAKHPKVCDTAMSKRSVRCCSIDGKAVGMGLYGCNAEKTLQEALGVCASKSLRLCTSSEIESGLACGTGCGFDSQRVWTLSACQEPLTMIKTLAGCPRSNAQKHPESCDAVAQKRSVRCCSMNGAAVSMSVYGCNADRTYQEAIAICSSNNLRLCSLLEISSNQACGTGCGFDGQRIWTLTSCRSPNAKAKTVSGCPRASENSHPETCDAVTERRSVRCCSQEGASVNMGIYGCHSQKTYEEALAVCSSNNLRICSFSEIMSNLVCGTGCDFDRHRVWTSTECE